MPNTRLLVCVFDKAANEIHGNVGAERHANVAIRAFDDIAKNPQTNIGRYPKDHELWCIGTIDFDTMEITPKKELLLSGEQWLAIQQSNEGEK